MWFKTPDPNSQSDLFITYRFSQRVARPVFVAISGIGFGVRYSNSGTGLLRWLIVLVTVVGSMLFAVYLYRKHPRFYAVLSEEGVCVYPPELHVGRKISIFTPWSEVLGLDEETMILKGIDNNDIASCSQALTGNPDDKAKFVNYVREHAVSS